MNGTRLAALSVVALLLATHTACAPYEPLPRKTSFLFPGVHGELTCEQCHGAGPPFYPFVWDTKCKSCHEADRKPTPPDPVSTHYTPLGCSEGSSCHSDTDPSWLERLGGGPPDTGVQTGTNSNHAFLPLEGAHAEANGCTPCHDGASPSAANVIPAGGNSKLCWSCHEEDRFFPGHYVLTEAEAPPGAVELRRDCKACHDLQSRDGEPVGGEYFLWEPYGLHGGIRYPHGMEGDSTPQAEADYVTDCLDCHAALPVSLDPSYVCTAACHEDIFLAPIPQHSGFQPGANDSACTACHVYADIRQF